MKKEELKIVGLSYSHTHSGSYVLVLGQLDGKLKLPIIIKSHEAQIIALKVEGMKSPKPLLHDIVHNLTQIMSMDLQQVLISNIVEGVFHCKLIFSSFNEDFSIECSIGDAIALSLVYSCPIMCNREVLSVSGILMNNDGDVSEEQEEENKKDRDYRSVLSLDNLQKMLDKALDNEEYEIASQLRDRIKELKDKE